MSNYYENLSLIKSIDKNNLLWLKLKSVYSNLPKQFYVYPFLNEWMGFGGKALVGVQGAKPLNNFTFFTIGGSML